MITDKFASYAAAKRETGPASKIGSTRAWITERRILTRRPDDESDK
jgi:hypothetical protein